MQRSQDPQTLPAPKLIYFSNLYDALKIHTLKV